MKAIATIITIVVVLVLSLSNNANAQNSEYNKHQLKAIELINKIVSNDTITVLTFDNSKEYRLDVLCEHIHREFKAKGYGYSLKYNKLLLQKKGSRFQVYIEINKNRTIKHVIIKREE